MKVLYLFNKVLGPTVEAAKEGSVHDSWLFGMLRLKKYGVETNFLEIEKFIPTNIAATLRKRILTMHYAHLPLFPLFFRYDVVFTSTAYGCLVLKSLLGIKRFKWVILDFNILGTIQDRKTYKQKIFYWAIKNGADGIVAISQAEASELKKEFPHLKDKIIFLHEPTDVDFFKQEQEIEEKNSIISVGNYGRDFETIIEAVKGLDTKLVVATKLRVKNANILGDRLSIREFSPQELVKAYSEARIAVVSLNTKDAYFDSVGTLALGEALSMGKPTVVTYTKSMESYVDSENAVFVQRGNVEEMKNAIELLLRDEGKRRQLAQNARAFALNNLDPEVFALKLSIFLKNVV